MDIVARDLRIKHDMICVAANWFAMGLPDGLLDEDEARQRCSRRRHGTSMMLTLKGDLVAMEHCPGFPALQFAHLPNHDATWALGPVASWDGSHRTCTPAGAMGNAAAATEEKGRAFVDHAARRACDVVAGSGRRPSAPSVLDNPADPEGRVHDVLASARDASLGKTGAPLNPHRAGMRKEFGRDIVAVSDMSLTNRTGGDFISFLGTIGLRENPRPSG